MILQIDCGNTMLKWRVVDYFEHVCQDGSISSRDSSLLSQIDFDFDVDDIQVTNVAGEQWCLAIDAWARKRWQLRPRFAKVQRAHCGLQVAEHNLDQLGVDRWLALLAGFQLRKNLDAGVVVISAGTAITIDGVTANGRHLGGYIGPGMSAQTEILRSSAAQLSQIECADQWIFAPGQDTQACVAAGVSLMQRGMIGLALQQFRGIAAIGVVYITGGNGRQIKRCLPNEKLQYVEDLPLKGLSYAFQSRQSVLPE